MLAMITKWHIWIAILAVGIPAFKVWMLVDCVNHETKTVPKVIWLLVIILPLGSLLYFFVRKLPRANTPSQPVLPKQPTPPPPLSPDVEPLQQRKSFDTIRPIEMAISLKKRWRLLFILIFTLVVLPLLLILASGVMGEMEQKFPPLGIALLFIDPIVLVISVLWFLPPALLFPNHWFLTHDFGNTTPRGWQGWAATVVLYLVLAVVLWLLFGLRRKKTR